MKVNELTRDDVTSHLQGGLAEFDDTTGINWYVAYTSTHGWIVTAVDNDGTSKYWTIRLGEAGEEL